MGADVGRKIGQGEGSRPLSDLAKVLLRASPRKMADNQSRRCRPATALRRVVITIMNDEVSAESARDLLKAAHSPTPSHPADRVRLALGIQRGRHVIVELGRNELYVRSYSAK